MERLNGNKLYARREGESLIAKVKEFFKRNQFEKTVLMPIREQRYVFLESSLERTKNGLKEKIFFNFSKFFKFLRGDRIFQNRIEGDV